MSNIRKFAIYTLTLIFSLFVYIILLDDIVRSISTTFNMFWILGDHIVYPLVIYGYALFPCFCLWCATHIANHDYELSNKDINYLFVNYILVMSTLLVKPVLTRSYNIRFTYLAQTLRQAAHFNPIDFGNIILFSPMAFFLYNKIKNPNFIKCFIVFIMIVFMIETSQYIFKIGIFDINDMILNTIGFILGYITLMISKLFQVKENVYSIE